MTARMKELPAPLEDLFSGLVSIDFRVEGGRVMVRDRHII
jgi:hypothetical protein